MLQKRQARLLRDEIEVLLTPLSDTEGFYNMVKEPLSRFGRGLAHEIRRDRPWPLLTLIVCEAACGHYEQAVPAAAACQLLVAAADVFDDVEDADSSESLSFKYGSAKAINVATTLLILAEKAITRLKQRGVEASVVIRVMDAINSYYTTACIGQQLDLSLGTDKAVSEDLYLKIIDMKSASQVESACHIGALLANTNQELIDILSTFGHNLGMAVQVTNDIRGITKGDDIIRHRITLPIIYALTQTDGEVRNQFESAFGKQSESKPDPVQIKDLLFNCGAIYYATIKMEFYKQQALDSLSEAERVGACVKRLKLFLE